jgi:hypothetical protein
MSSLDVIDRDLEAWASTLPTSWAFTTDIRTHIPAEDCYTTSCHSYPSFGVASAWADYRMARCIAKDLLLTQLDYIRSTETDGDVPGLLAQHKQSREVVQELCNDICASIPYLLGYVDHGLPKSGSGAIRAMWVLFVCACMHYVPETQRLWAIEQLERIGHRMGIHQTLPLADLMRKKVQLLRSPRDGQDSLWEDSILSKDWYEKLRTELFLSNNSLETEHTRALP